MPTIQIGATIYEVYGDQAEANNYFTAAVNGPAWSAASSSDRNKALVTATRVFERTMWAGQPTSPIDRDPAPAPGTQPLQWPRTGLEDRNGSPLDSAVIPESVIAGNFEYALELVVAPAIQSQAASGSNVKVEKSSERVEGAITVSQEKQYFRSTLGAFGQFPTIVQDYVGLWLAGGAGQLTFISGSDVVSPIAGQGGFFNYGPNGIP